MNILELPGSLTWALRILDVAAAATVFSVFDLDLDLFVVLRRVQQPGSYCDG